jgi:hypothetical protein
MKFWVRQVATHPTPGHVGWFPDAHWLTFQICDVSVGSGVAAA